MAVRHKWFEVSERKSVVDRPEKMDVRPRLRFERTISSNRVIRGSLDFGLVRSRSLMNSLKPIIGSVLPPRCDMRTRQLTLCLLQNCDILRMLTWKALHESLHVEIVIHAGLLLITTGR